MLNLSSICDIFVLFSLRMNKCRELCHFLNLIYYQSFKYIFWTSITLLFLFPHSPLPPFLFYLLFPFLIQLRRKLSFFPLFSLVFFSSFFLSIPLFLSILLFFLFSSPTFAFSPSLLCSFSSYFSPFFSPFFLSPSSFISIFLSYLFSPPPFSPSSFSPPSLFPYTPSFSHTSPPPSLSLPLVLLLRYAYMLEIFEYRQRILRVLYISSFFTRII